MTLLTAWIRGNSTHSQLVVAADSMLSFGARWSCCPKIFPLRRNDSVLAFGGDTKFAYPVLLQLSNSASNYEKALSREIDISALRTHFIKIIESMHTTVTDFPSGRHGIDPTDFVIVFAGYSAQAKEFKAWRLFFDKSERKFLHRPLSFHATRTKSTKSFLFAGDHVKEAVDLLYEKLTDRKKLTTGTLDMEPLEVLVDMIESPEFKSIGGPPQLVKVYSFANVLPMNVFWPRNHPTCIAHFGRPLLPYEGSKYACLDLNDNSLWSPYEATKKIQNKNTSASVVASVRTT